jgi:membrane associated rhomboid family serine protease
VVFYLLGVFVDLEAALSNNLRYTVYKFEIYRLLTSALLSGGLINLIFGLMAMNQLGSALEYQSGSARFLALMGTLALCGNLAFLAVVFLLSVLGQPDAEFMSASGFWNVLMPLMAVQCMATPDQPRKLFFFPCEIASKFYPLALFAILSLMSGIRLDMALGLGMGYAFSLGKLSFADPSNARIQGWESGCMRRFTSRAGYVVGAAGQEAWLPVNPNVRADSSGYPQQQQQQQQPRGAGNSVEEGSGSSEWVSRNGGAVTAPSVANKKVQQNAFAGSGNTLGGSSNSRSNGSSFMALGRGSSGADSSDPAAARAARLAALESRSSASSGTTTAATAVPSSGRQSGSSAANSGRGGNAETSSLLASADHEVCITHCTVRICV